MSPTEAPTLVPTKEPSTEPSLAPTPAPTQAIGDFGCGCEGDNDCINPTSSCADGSGGTATCGNSNYCKPGHCNVWSCQTESDCCSSNPYCHATGNCYCFPGDALVEEETKGPIAIEDVQVGDSIRTANGFSKVYGFGHGLEDATGEFFRLNTDFVGTAIELSAYHQVFVGFGSETKYAKDVEVGDVLVLANRTAPVTSIEVVQKKGIYNIYTYAGTFFVNGVLASQHTQSPHVAVGSVELFSKHEFKYMAHAPTRILCTFASGTVLCSHKNKRLDASIVIDSALEAFMPGVMAECVNFLSFDHFFPMRFVLLLFWILPVYWLEQAGLVTIVAILGGWILYRKAPMVFFKKE